MRIGVVTTSYPRSPGEAAGGFVAELNRWIASAGHEVQVLAAGSGDQDAGWQDLPVTRVPAASGLFYEGGAPDALRSLGPKWQALAFSARLLRQIRKDSRAWDGMVAHWLVPSALACVLGAGNKPIWAIAHGGDVHLLAKLRLTRAVARLLDRPNLHLNFVSKAVRDVFAKNAGKAAEDLLARSGVCSMGIDLSHFEKLRGTPSPSAKPLILFLGRLVPIKGVDLLLEALRDVKGEFRVVVAGAGPEKDALQQQARDYGLEIEWPGEVRGQARDALLAAAEVVVMPSRRDDGREEGMPVVALEALASGAELLVSESGGLAEIPESICHRVPPENAPALRDQLQALLEGKRAAYAPGHWLEEHDWRSIGPRLLPGLS
jgi:glycosyltransferase involved in cell wall biosynthesis